MNHVIHPEALEEYAMAGLYYDNQTQGLGAEFSEDIEETIQRILDAPHRWAFFEQDVRRCLAHRFPYGILYTVENDHVLIVAVMHLSRNPGYWKTRLPSRLHLR